MSAPKPKTKPAKQKPKAQKHQQTRANKVLSGVGGALGSLLGQSQLGKDAGSWLSEALGMGSYSVKTNSFTTSSEGVPNFEYNSDGSIVITHREYVMDVIGSVGYVNTAFDIDPCNSSLCPWLCEIAAQFEQFDFLGLLACFNSTSGDAIASTNNALGTVIISTEYDVSKPNFTNKSDMENYFFTVSKKPSVSFIHPVECANSRDIVKARYVASGFRQHATSTYVLTNTANDQLVADNLNTLGRLQIATVGMQAATTVGELWITYKIKVAKPRQQMVGFPTAYYHSTAGFSGLATGPITTSSLLPFTGSNVVGDSTARLSAVYNDTYNIYLPQQRPNSCFRITYCATAVSGTTPTFTMGQPTLFNCTGYQSLFPGNNTGTVFYISGNGTSNYTLTFSVSMLATSYSLLPTIAFAAVTLGGTNPTFTWDLNVTAMPSLQSINYLLSMTELLSEFRLARLNRVRIPPESDEVDEKYSLITLP
jgi:hypothetical protein